MATTRTLYFDCFSGASGDMILGSLLDLGLNIKELETELAKLSLDGYRIEARKICKSGFSATKFDVIEETTKSQEHTHDHLHNHHHENGHAQHHDHGHDHNHDHNHNHNHNHNHDHDHDHDNVSHANHNHQHHGPHRNLNDILQMINNSGLNDKVKENSTKIFKRLAVAEAKIHGTVPEKIHFHEVGAIDAIVDIVGAVIGFSLLQIDKIVISPLPMGKGFVKCQHGTIPVPAPATVELLVGIKSYGSEHHGETVTPTGAAILSTLADSVGPMPMMTVHKTGYGAGTRDFAGPSPNLLRAILGEEDQESIRSFDGTIETITELEANIDDMNPEFYDYIFETIFKNGALDVFLIPIQMKKNRPANIIKVLCNEKDVNQIAGILFRETTTLGVRINKLDRLCLQREFTRVQTEYGEITVKQGLVDGIIVNQAPEYEDCKEKARQSGVPLKNVYHAALRSIEEQPRQ